MSAILRRKRREAAKAREVVRPVVEPAIVKKVVPTAAVPPRPEESINEAKEEEE